MKAKATAIEYLISGRFCEIEDDEPDTSTEQILERVRQEFELPDIGYVTDALVATGTFRARP